MNVNCTPNSNILSCDSGLFRPVPRPAPQREGLDKPQVQSHPLAVLLRMCSNSTPENEAKPLFEMRLIPTSRNETDRQSMGMGLVRMRLNPWERDFKIHPLTGTKNPTSQNPTQYFAD